MLEEFSFETQLRKIHDYPFVWFIVILCDCVTCI